MPLCVVALALLAANPTVTKLASPGLTAINLDKKTADFFSDHFAQQLVVRGFTVTTQSEISAVLGLERQKQLLGCSSESPSCLAELAGALGVDALITGSLGKFEGGYAVNIKIIGASSGATVAAFAGRLKNDDAVLDWLTGCAEQLANRVGPHGTGGGGKPLLSDTGVEASGRFGAPVVVPAAAGAVLLIGGGVLFAMAKSLEGRLASGDRSAVPAGGTVDGAVRTGTSLQTWSVACAGLGLAGVVTAGVVAWLKAPDAAAGLTVLPTQGGVAVSFGGSLP